MADPYGNGPAGDERTIGQLVVDVSEKTTLLVREEIQLAKAEISEKVMQLVRGGVVGIAAGVFLVAFAFLTLQAIALGLNDLFFEGHPWAGFLVEAIFWLIVAGLAGWFAYRSFQRGAPPVPDMAIEEARLTRETFGGGPTPVMDEVEKAADAAHERFDVGGEQN